MENIKIPQFKVEMIGINLLKIYDKNTKKHPKEQIEIIAKSIKEFGFRNPILINNLQEKLIIAGHGRAKAAESLGMKEVPCISAEDLTPEQIKLFRIMDNKSTESEWNLDLLSTEFKEMSDLKLDLSFTGFNEKEINEILHIPSLEAQDDGFVEVGAYERAKEKSKVQTGDVYQLDYHRLMCGDSTKKQDVDNLMNEEKADLLLTDPPYGVNYSAKNIFLNSIDKGNRVQNNIENDTGTPEETKLLWDKSLKLAQEYLKEGGSYYVNSMQGGDLLLLLSLKEAGLELKHSLVWVKNNHVLGRSDYNYKH